MNEEAREVFPDDLVYELNLEGQTSPLREQVGRGNDRYKGTEAHSTNTMETVR